MILTKGCKYLEKNTISLVSSVAHSVWHIVDNQQMLMTSHRTADVPGIQVTFTTNFTSEFLGRGKSTQSSYLLCWHPVLYNAFISAGSTGKMITLLCCL